MVLDELAALEDVGAAAIVFVLGEGEGEGWSGECGRSVPSRQIVEPARRRRTRVVEKNVLGACPHVHVRVLSEEVPFTRRSGAGRACVRKRSNVV